MLRIRAPSISVVTSGGISSSLDNLSLSSTVYAEQIASLSATLDNTSVSSVFYKSLESVTLNSFVMQKLVSYDLAKPTTNQTNFFFNNFKATSEQNLLENLILESISIYGHECYYIPRKINNFDSIYTEDDSSSYEDAFPLVTYIDSVNGFSGDQEFFSKFGVEIRNQLVISIARRTFDISISKVTEQIRPNEGDIIYFPLNKRIFIIRFVDNYEFFYQLGSLYTWKCTCENFEYSNERFSTGLPEIDSIQTNLSTNVLDWTYKDENGNILIDEDQGYLIQEKKKMEDMIVSAENDKIQTESDQFILFDSQNPFSEGSL